MPTHMEVLFAVQAKIAAIPTLAGAEVEVRPEIAYIRDVDTLPLVVVAPRRDQWEQVAALFFDGANTHQGGVRLDFPVLVALIISNAFDLQQLGWQLSMREAIRRRLWDARAISDVVTTVTDVDYNPVPRGVDLTALAPPLDASLQQFTYRSDEVRYVP